MDSFNKEEIRKLSVRDFITRGIRIDKEWDPFRALVVVAAVASQVHEEEKMQKVDHGGVERCCNSVGSSKNPRVFGLGFDDSTQERLKREKALKKPITGFEFNNHLCFKKDFNNKGVVVREEELLSSAIGSYALFNEKHEQVKEDGGLEESKKTGSKRKHVDINEGDPNPSCSTEKPKNKNKKIASKKPNSNGNKKSSKFKIPDNLESTPPQIPENLKDYIVNHLNGSNPELVIQKQIYETDASNGHNRLSIPYRKIRDINVFTQEEREQLENNVKLQTIFVEPSLKICEEIGLRKWNMSRGNKIYTLMSGWNKFRARSGLKVNDIVQVWLFRVEGDPRIGLTIVKLGEAMGEGNCSTGEGNNSSNGASNSQNAVSVQGSNNGSLSRESEEGNNIYMKFDESKE